MKTLIFSASPRSEGWTNKLLRLILKDIRDYKIYYPYKMNIKPCIDCGYCSRNPDCFIEDDFKNIYEDIKSAENIIIASPVYFGGFPSPMKMIIDRSQNFYFNKILIKKNLYLVITCGRKREDMEKALMLEAEFFAKAINGIIAEAVTLRDTDSGNFNVDYDKVKTITEAINDTLIL